MAFILMWKTYCKYNIMEDRKLKEQLQKCTFYFYKSNLFIKSEVTRVIEMEGIFLEISFECDNVDAFIENIVPVKRPPNIVKKFEWCYMPKNEDDECVGYIGKIEKMI